MNCVHRQWFPWENHACLRAQSSHTDIDFWPCPFCTEISPDCRNLFYSVVYLFWNIFHYSEIASQFVDFFFFCILLNLCSSLPLRDSASPRCSFDAQSHHWPVGKLISCNMFLQLFLVRAFSAFYRLHPNFFKCWRHHQTRAFGELIFIMKEHNFSLSALDMFWFFCE